MAEFPALPLFTDAYLADTSHLTHTEHGRYLLLLIAIWRAPGCRLPDDDAWLARKFQISEIDVKNFMRPLVAEFCIVQCGWITQKRLKKVWDWCQAKRQKSRTSAKTRWQKEKDLCVGNASVAMPPIQSNPRKKERKEVNADAVGASSRKDASSRTEQERELFGRGKQVLGKNAGGMISVLLKSREYDVALARAVIETASTKQDPREYVAAAIRGGNGNGNGYHKQRESVVDILKRQLAEDEIHPPSGVGDFFRLPQG